MAMYKEFSMAKERDLLVYPGHCVPIYRSGVVVRLR